MEQNSINFNISTDSLLLQSLLLSYEKNDDINSINEIISKTKNKKGITYINKKNIEELIDERECSSIMADMLNPILDVSEAIEDKNRKVIGYIMLDSGKLRGNIQQIGTLTGSTVKGFNVNLPVYNKCAGDFLGYIPINTSLIDGFENTDTENTTYEINDIFPLSGDNYKYLAVFKHPYDKTFWIPFFIIGTFFTLNEFFHWF